MPGLGTVWVELDLDRTRWEKSQQQVLRDATSTAVNVEENFRKLGIKSSAHFDLMRQAAANSYERILNYSKRTNEDILSAQNAYIARMQAIKAEEEKQHRTVWQRMSDEHANSTAGMVRGILRLYAAYYVVANAAQYAIVPFVKGFHAVEDYNTSVAALAANVVTFSERQKDMDLAGQWQYALAYSKQMVPVLEELAAKTLLSGQETVALANAFARSGVFIDSANKAQIEAFTRISNALPLMTQGQDILRQINTEIRSLMTGANEQSSMLLTTLKAIDPEIEKNLKTWREEGTVLDHIGEMLVGFGPATAELENQWTAVKSTIETTATQILRDEMKPVYEEIIGLVKEMDSLLQQSKGSATGLGEVLAGIVRDLKRDLPDIVDSLKPFITLMKVWQIYLETPLHKASQPYRSGLSPIYEAFAGRGGGGGAKTRAELLMEIDPALAAFEMDYSGVPTPRAPQPRKISGETGTGSGKSGASDATRNERDRLKAILDSYRATYEGAVEAAEHAAKMQAIYGNNELNFVLDAYSKKQNALAEWYGKSADAIKNNVSDEKVAKAKLEALWTDYSKQWERLANRRIEAEARVDEFRRKAEQSYVTWENMMEESRIRNAKTRGGTVHSVSEEEWDRIGRFKAEYGRAPSAYELSMYSGRSTEDRIYEFIQGIGDSGTDFASIISDSGAEFYGSTALAAANVYYAWAQLVKMIMEAVTEIVNFPKEFINTATNLFAAFANFAGDQMTAFDQMLAAWEKMWSAEGIGKLFGEFPARLIKLIPEIIHGFIHGLPEIIQAISDSIPMVTQALVDTIPMVIDTIIKDIPRIISALVKAIMNMGSGNYGQTGAGWGDIGKNFGINSILGGGFPMGGGLISNVFGFGGGGGGGGLGGIVKSIGHAFSDIFHEGGVVGMTPVPQRMVPAAAFFGAPRLHRGLGANEFPAILERGETVIPKGRSGAMYVHMPVNINGVVTTNNVDEWLAGRMNRLQKYRHGKTYMQSSLVNAGLSV